MNVHPGLTEHAKFRLLKTGLRGIGAPEELAMEVLIRLWGHCQTMQRGENWGRVTAEYVEAVCCWSGKPGALFDLLAKDFCGQEGWIRVQRGQVIICGWEEHNKSLLNRWYAGPKGGRPKGTGKKPANNLQVTGSKPTENRILDRSREERRGDDLRGDEGKDSLSPAAPGVDSVPSTFAEWPGEKEWREFCAEIGLPEWKVAREWTNQERKRPKWANVGNWRSHANHIKVLWEQDGRPMDPPNAPRSGGGIKNGATPEKASSVIYALEREKEALMTTIGEHVANGDSSAYDPNCTAEQKQDLQTKKARLREVFGLIAKGGRA